MEARRIFWNRKSVILFIVFLLLNIGLFAYGSWKDYTPLSREEIQEVDYSKKYEKIKKQMESLRGVSIFNTQSNLLENEKILRDYGRICFVSGETHQREGIGLWYASSMQNYFSLFFCIWLVFLTFDVEKRGLFPLVYATKRGRGVLALRRLLYYFFAAIGSSVIFNFVLLLLACAKAQNISALWQPIQYVNSLKGCILPVNGIAFFCVLSLVSACGIFVVTLLCWMILLMIHNSKIALTICGMFFVLEYSFKQWLPDQSQLSMLKYINILTLLDMNPLYGEYQLYTAGSICLERKEWIYIAIVFLSVFLAVFCIVLSSKRRPCYQKHLLERAVQKIFCRIRSVLSRMPGKFFEGYKMLVSQKGLYILIFFFIILIKGVWQPQSEGEQLTLGSTGEYMKEFYEEWTGPVTEQVDREITERERQLVQLQEEDHPAAAYYSNGLKKLKERVDYAKGNREKDLWLVNPDGYRYLFGEKGERSMAESTLLVSLCMMLLISGVFTYEKKSSMEFLLRASLKGRSCLRKRKYTMVAILVVFLWLVLNGMELYNISRTYSLSGLSAPVQSLSFMAKVPVDVTIWQYCLWVYATRLFWLFLSAVVYCEIAMWLKNQEISFLLCGLLLLPSILYLMGLEMFSWFSITKIIHVSHFFRQGVSGIGKEAVIGVFIVLLLVASKKIRRLTYVKD